MAALTIAKLTVWEASRRRLLLALLLLTLVIIGLTGWGFTKLGEAGNGQRLPDYQIRLIASQLLIVIVFMFAGVLALSSVVLASPTISSDVESGVLLALLARPVRRLDVVLGKWLGLAVLVVIYAAGAAILELLVLWWATGYLPPRPVELIVYVAGEGIILMTLALALSTRLAGMTGGIIALVGYFMAWIGGIVGGVGQAIHNDGLVTGGLIMKLLLPTDALWRGAVFAMEPATVIAALKATGSAGAGNPFGATEPPATAFLLWTVLWLVAVFGLTYWGFRRRAL
ncbi:MAG: ABC transporter permease [Candidatus Dormibacteraeota bacterium]|uniref:ABC transporter permease n=1 Tax=Candidatus Dormiibacter inghamiae TaxID=3127013 RepID=A0A934KA77_9BACT|nr:ABC transporter permease [Candidatus Dormibacteraeota bacterium]MBJ7606574.1 ABC transporter permease [Candidatus Dormibacteraeota bacterium]